MSLCMSGHIDDTFVSTGATRFSYSTGGYVNGRYVAGTESASPHTINLQPASMKQIDALQNGGERITDARNVYVNDGDIYTITKADEWTFNGVAGRFKCIHIDNRSQFDNSRNYCKLVVSRIDGSV